MKNSFIKVVVLIIALSIILLSGCNEESSITSESTTHLKEATAPEKTIQTDAYTVDNAKIIQLENIVQELQKELSDLKTKIENLNNNITESTETNFNQLEISNVNTKVENDNIVILLDLPNAKLTLDQQIRHNDYGFDVFFSVEGDSIEGSPQMKYTPNFEIEKLSVGLRIKLTIPYKGRDELGIVRVYEFITGRVAQASWDTIGPDV